MFSFRAQFLSFIFEHMLFASVFMFFNEYFKLKKQGYIGSRLMGMPNCLNMRNLFHSHER